MNHNAPSEGTSVLRVPRAHLAGLDVLDNVVEPLLEVLRVDGDLLLLLLLGLLLFLCIQRVLQPRVSFLHRKYVELLSFQYNRTSPVS